MSLCCFFLFQVGLILCSQSGRHDLIDHFNNGPGRQFRSRQRWFSPLDDAGQFNVIKIAFNDRYIAVVNKIETLSFFLRTALFCVVFFFSSFGESLATDLIRTQTFLQPTVSLLRPTAKIFERARGNTFRIAAYVTDKLWHLGNRQNRNCNSCRITGK